MTATEVGAYIRGLREHFKLSALDVSERLHIRVRYVNAIEENKYYQMPGKVYARGYVHTYAEFLGLDADQVVTLCFGKDETQAKPVFNQPMGARKQSLNTNWRGLGTVAVVGVFVLLMVSLFSGGDDTSAPEQQAPEPVVVAAVPEALLETVRDSVMPTANNGHCLNSNLWLGCFFADRPMRAVLKFDGAVPVMLAGKLDLSDIAAIIDEEAELIDEPADIDEALNEPEELPPNKKPAPPEKKKPVKIEDKKPAKKEEKKPVKIEEKKPVKVEEIKPVTEEKKPVKVEDVF